MKVVRLQISGFRGIKEGTIDLDSFAVLIGANNCGKTTVIEALALLLGRDRLIRSLTEHDFYGSNPQPEDRISIIATIAGFEPEDPQHHSEWFRMGRGIAKWFDPVTGRVYPGEGMGGATLVCQIAFFARFDKSTLETDIVRFFYDDESQEDPFQDDASFTPLPAFIVRELGLFLVPASRTWDRMISFSSELFKRTVAYVGGKPAEAVLEERDRLRRPQAPLEEDEKLQALVGSVNTDLRRLFGRTTELKLRLTSTDSEGVLEAVVPHFAGEDGMALPARRHGNGLISLQTLVLLMRFGHLRKAGGDSFIMAIEEPELHVPPHPQRKLLHLMKQMATQTIITTHSPTVAAVPDPHQIILLVNKEGRLSANRLLEAPLGMTARSVRRALFLADRVSTVSAIMHPCIIVPEGKTDHGWLRLLARVADLTEAEGDLDAVTFTHEVGVIPTKDAAVVDTYRELVRVHPSITCLVDGDQAGRGYVALLAAAVPPCERAIIWPEGWAIEHVIDWICSADPAVLSDPELIAIEVPQERGMFLAFLQNNKTDEVVHGVLADAIALNPLCAARARHVLQVLASIASGRDVVQGAANSVVHPNGVTTIWTFANAFPGV